MSDQAEKNAILFNRRHPMYATMAAHWLFLEQTYAGGRQWFPENIWRYYKEGDQEFEDRVDRAYRFNHTREAVDLVQKYLFKGKVSRSDSAPDFVSNFWKSSTLSGLNIDQVMRLVSVENSIGGRVAIVVDTNKRPEDKTLSIADEKRLNIRPYVYTVKSSDILDYAYDEVGDGGLLWVTLREKYRNDENFFSAEDEVIDRVRLWTRNEWLLLEKTGDDKEQKVTIVDQGEHDLGKVPVVFCDHIIGHDPYRAPGLIDDISYLDKAAANYLSDLDAIIQDQTFSQLAIPAQSIMPGDDAYDAVLKAGTKRMFVYDASAGSAAPQYISPDPKQAGVILDVVNKIINEIYHTIGLAGERTKQDNAVGIDNSSGVAKAYDFERVNSLLRAKAESLQKAENEVIEILALWTNQTTPEDDLIIYPTTFDVMRLADDLAVAESLAKLDAPIELRREQMRVLTDKLFPHLKKTADDLIDASIKEWLEGIDAELNPPSNFGSSKKSPSASSKQGQVTEKTK